MEHKPADAELTIRIPMSGVSRYVAELAARHHVTYSRCRVDEWAHVVTRLSGDEVRSDETCDLLVALRRAHKLTDLEMAALLISHLRERKHVRVSEDSEPRAVSEDATQGLSR